MPDRVSVNRVSICSDNGLSPILRQAIIQTNDGLLSIWFLEPNFHGYRWRQVWILAGYLSFLPFHPYGLKSVNTIVYLCHIRVDNVLVVVSLLNWWSLISVDTSVCCWRREKLTITTHDRNLHTFQFTLPTSPRWPNHGIGGFHTETIWSMLRMGTLQLGVSWVTTPPPNTFSHHKPHTTIRLWYCGLLPHPFLKVFWVLWIPFWDPLMTTLIPVWKCNYMPRKLLNKLLIHS